MDTLEFRLKNLDNDRMRNVFTAGSEKFGWGRTKAENHGYGMGGGYEKLGYVATFVEVAVHPATRVVKILRVVTAFECGAVVNPDGLRNQVEGANIMGLGEQLSKRCNLKMGEFLTGDFQSIVCRGLVMCRRLRLYCWMKDFRLSARERLLSWELLRPSATQFSMRQAYGCARCRCCPAT